MDGHPKPAILQGESCEDLIGSRSFKSLLRTASANSKLQTPSSCVKSTTAGQGEIPNSNLENAESGAGYSGPKRKIKAPDEVLKDSFLGNSP